MSKSINSKTTKGKLSTKKRIQKYVLIGLTLIMLISMVVPFVGILL